ncbi:MAG: hypothetical protein JWN72_1263 [Thermoleophilia bacterium]|nr:hypothetical protein [Thermoleophilia bacterium]
MLAFRRLLLTATVAACAVAGLVPAAPAATAATVAPTFAAPVPATSVVQRRDWWLDTGRTLTCPASVDACSAKVVARALVHPAVGAPRVVVVGVATLTYNATVRVRVHYNAAGVRELRTRGALRMNVLFQTAANGHPAARYTAVLNVGPPPVVVLAATRLTKLTLLPSQHLVLRLTGENAASGYAWKLDDQATGSSLKLIMVGSYLDPTCHTGSSKCLTTREYTFAPTKAGTAHVSVGLYGPEPETDATVRIDLDVTTKARPPAAKVVVDPKVGATVTLAKGQDLVVRLTGESGSTGYVWHPLAPLPTAATRRVSSVLYPARCAAGAVGCPSVREFTYVNARPGATMVSAELTGPGSTEANAMLRLTVITR